MAEVSDEEFQKQLVEKCAKQIIDDIKKPEVTKKKLDKINEIMKSYEDQLYERYIKKSELEEKNEKQEIPNQKVNRQPNDIYNRYPFVNPDEKPEGQFQGEYIKYPYVADSNFLSNFNRTFQGYGEIPGFNPQQQYPGYNLESYEKPGTFHPPNQMPPQNKNYLDTYSNSKFYYPQDHNQNYYGNQVYSNKPIHDITNQQAMYLQNDLGSTQTKENHSPWHTLRANNQLQQQMQKEQMSNQLPDEEMRLRRNIEILGGIERTIPNIEKSLYENELSNIEQNFRQQNNFDSTSNPRVNNLLQNAGSNIRTPFQQPTMRASSPLKGDFPTLQKPPLYVSPRKPNFPGGGYPQDGGMYGQPNLGGSGNWGGYPQQQYGGPQGGYGGQQHPQFNPNYYNQQSFRPDENDGQDTHKGVEKTLYDPKKISLSSSKALRAQRTEQLNPKFNFQ